MPAPAQSPHSAPQTRFRNRSASALPYALTIFLSAFLLFQVEPLIAKLILPWFGGAAAVWSVCLLFFQVVLLLGYTYAHVLTRLTPRKQTVVHLSLLVASLLVLPISLGDSWKPTSSEDPAFRILLLLTATIGLPFFVLSSTSPLLQAWYSRGESHKAPYRFYALSNAGSMLALLSYPLVVEPKIATHVQAVGWSIAYALVAAVCGWIAVSFRSIARNAGEETFIPRPGWQVQLLWILLASCASALLLAVTNHISQNIAAVPFLWVLPLSLYLLSLVLCFDSERWYPRSVFFRLLGIALATMTYALTGDFANSPTRAIPLFCAALFVCCMFCHGELARLKPDSQHLTTFYLMVSLGGALGAMFVALVAPRVFRTLAELPVSIAACAVLAVVTIARDPEPVFPRTARGTAVAVTGAVALALVASLFAGLRRPTPGTRITVRNFYGILRVSDHLAKSFLTVQPNSEYLFEAPDPRYRELVNGAINHGEQFLTRAMRRQPTTYYGPNSGVGIALKQAGEGRPVRAGIIGLGAGTLAAYARPGDSYTFYEINPLVIDIANHEFSFLRDSEAKIEIVSGDARLSLEREGPQKFDVLAVDAFSGDSIPVHLLTREAFEVYLRHLAPDGVLAVHISNKYLDLQPVVEAAARKLGKRTLTVSNGPDDNHGIFSATWVLLTGASDFPFRNSLARAGQLLPPASREVLWTDDYSSVFPLLK